MMIFCRDAGKFIPQRLPEGLKATLRRILHKIFISMCLFHCNADGEVESASGYNHHTMIFRHLNISQFIGFRFFFVVCLKVDSTGRQGDVKRDDTQKKVPRWYWPGDASYILTPGDVFQTHILKRRQRRPACAQAKPLCLRKKLQGSYFPFTTFS